MVGREPPMNAPHNSSINPRPYPLCAPNGSSATALSGSVVGFPSLSTAQFGGSGLPSRLSCWTRPIATVDVAQSMTMGNPIAFVVGNAHECGFVPRVGNLPPNGTTSASADVQQV